MAFNQDEDGNWVKIRVEECEFGCAQDGECASQWICHTRNVVGWVIISLLSLLCIISFLKRYVFEDKSEQGSEG